MEPGSRGPTADVSNWGPGAERYVITDLSCRARGGLDELGASEAIPPPNTSGLCSFYCARSQSYQNIKHFWTWLAYASRSSFHGPGGIIY